MNALRRMSGLVIAMVLIAFLTTTLVAQTTTQDPLVQVLVQKGVLTSGDAKTVTGNPQEQRDRLAQILREKGVLSATDLNSVRGSMPAGTFLPVAYTEQAKPMAPGDARPAAPSIIPAIAPVRVLQLEPAKAGGLIPDIKLGSGARLKFYGFLKASTVYDTSSPTGDDWPRVGFVNDSGADGTPEFHLKARASRVGANFEWPDISPKISVTGKLELDFEGNFTRANSVNGSTIRNSQPRIRLAWGRVDYKATDKTSLFALFGQDWTPFASSTMPNMVDTTILGGFFGNPYDRSQQFRVGMTHKFGGITVAPEFAIDMGGWAQPPAGGASGLPSQYVLIPSTCAAGVVSCTVSVTNLPGGLASQLAYGERVGADSARPEIQGRFVIQWQLDHAKGVAPAQIIFSGTNGRSTAVLTKAQIPCDNGTVGTACSSFSGGITSTLRTAFPAGRSFDTDRWGYTAEVQLPTRYVTAIAKYYRGGDLSRYAAGQGNVNYSNLNGVAGFIGTDNKVSPGSIDGAQTVQFVNIGTQCASGVCPAGTNWVPVPLNAVRTQGGVAQIGFPLSRIFNADPAGRNAGWTIFGTFGVDSVFAHDMIKVSQTNPRNKSFMAVGTLNYKLNQFVTFGIEESYYGSSQLTNVNNYGTVMPGVVVAGTVVPGFPGGLGSAALFRGIPAAKWHNLRTEFATIFTF